MAKKKEDNGAELLPVAETDATAGETRDMLVISLGVVGNPQAEVLSRIIQASLGKLTLEEAGLQIAALYRHLPLRDQRRFVEQADFIIGRVASVIKLLPERFSVK